MLNAVVIRLDVEGRCGHGEIDIRNDFAALVVAIVARSIRDAPPALRDYAMLRAHGDIPKVVEMRQQVSVGRRCR